MLNSYQVSFTLRQQTPLIHFQWMQDPATIRSSEFKPKFDRWIMEQEVGIHSDFTTTQELYKDKYASNLVGYGKQHVALDYQLQIEAQDVEVWEIRKQYPCYFGNMATDTSTHKHLVKSNDDLLLTITCFNPVLLKSLKTHLDTFLAHENFGTRQSKGFGCFTRSDISLDEFESTLTKVFDVAFKKEASMQKNTSEEDRAFHLFKFIESEYKLLKAGDAARKKESKLRDFFNGMRPVIEWEKPAMQEIINKFSNKPIRINSKTDNRKYVRALLGLAENFEYPKNDDIKIAVEHISKSGIQIKSISSPPI